MALRLAGWLWLLAQTPESLLDSGVGLLQQGRFAEAAGEITRAIEKNPKLAEAHYLLGLIRQERGDRELALASFQTAVKLAPRHAAAQARLAEVLTYVARARESGYEEAAAACRRALALNPKDVDSRFHLAWIDAQALRHAEALRGYQTVLAEQPKYPGARLGLAMAQLELHQDAAALAVLAAVVRDEPGNAPACQQYGLALSRNERCGEAVEALRRALALDGKNARAYYQLGTCYQRLGKAEEAGQAMARYRQEQAAASKRQQARFQAAAGRKYFMAGNMKEAIGAYRLSLEQVADGGVAVDLSAALLKAGAAAEVSALLTPYAREDARAAYMLAVAEHELKSNEAAYRNLLGALRIQSDFAEAHHLLGVVCLEMGREAEGRKHLEAAARLRPDVAGFRLP